MNRNDLPELLKEAAADEIAALDFTTDVSGLSLGGRVYRQIDPDDSNVTFPCWQLTTEGVQERTLGGDSEFLQKVYSLKAKLRDRRGAKDHSRDGAYRAWRAEVFDHFHQRRPVTPRVPACYWCEAEAGPAFAQDTGAYHLVTSELTLKFWVRVPRRRAEGPALAALGLQPAPGAA